MGAPDTAFVKQYKDTITLLSQQQDSRLIGAAMLDTNFKGETKTYQQYNQDNMVELSQRYQDTPIQLPDHRQRAIKPRYFVSNTLEDPVDALQMLVDPKSTYMQAKKAAANRKKDDLIIAALGGTALTGKDGTSSTALPSGQKIARDFPTAGVNTGMTKAKVLRAKRVLDAAEVEKTERYAAHTAAQLEDLLNTTEVTSSDYNIVKALVQGEVNTWIGFNWLHTERLLTDGNSSRLCYFWQKMGLQVAVQKEVEARVDERPDKNYAWQVYLRMCMNATRMEEVRVVEVACTES